MKFREARSLMIDARDYGLSARLCEMDCDGGFDDVIFDDSDNFHDYLGSEFYMVLVEDNFSPLDYSKAISWLEALLHGCPVNLVLVK